MVMVRIIAEKVMVESALSVLANIKEKDKVLEYTD
jgi:hypothetical protein